MAVASKPRSTFSDLLRADLAETGVSVSELARRLCSTNEDMVESRRRKIQSYLSSERVPGEKARIEIADALGIDRKRYAVDLEREKQLRRLMEAFRPIADILLDNACDARDKAAAEADE